MTPLPCRAEPVGRRSSSSARPTPGSSTRPKTTSLPKPTLTDLLPCSLSPAPGLACNHAGQSPSIPVDVILHKRDGLVLTDAEINYFVRAVVDRTPRPTRKSPPGSWPSSSAASPRRSSPPSPLPCASPVRPSIRKLPERLLHRQALHRRCWRQDLAPDCADRCSRGPQGSDDQRSVA